MFMLLFAFAFPGLAGWGSLSFLHWTALRSVCRPRYTGLPNSWGYWQNTKILTRWYILCENELRWGWRVRRRICIGCTSAVKWDPDDHDVEVLRCFIPPWTIRIRGRKRPGQPMWERVAHIYGLGILSKAYWRSPEMNITDLWWSQLFSWSCLTQKNISTVPLEGRKPHWDSGRIFSGKVEESIK